MMVHVSEHFHFGNWLRSEVAALGVSLIDFARQINASKNTMNVWVNHASPPIRESFQGRIAKALGIKISTVKSLLESATEGTERRVALHRALMTEQGFSRRPGSSAEGGSPGSSTGAMKGDAEIAEHYIKGVHSMRADVLGKLPETLDRNVDMTSLRALKPIPIWDLDIAAGGWRPVPINGELHLDDPKQRAIVEQGLFRVRIDGDSMAPDWLPGDIVEFSLFRPDRDVLMVGEDYLVISDESVGTFKKLTKVDEEELTLHAINRKKYPGKMTIARQQVARLAIAKWVVFDRRTRR